MSKLFKQNRTVYVLYGVIGLVCIGLSFFGLFDPKYPFYALMNTSCGFVFGFLYLFLMVRTATKQIENNGKQTTMQFMFSNLLRFLVIAADLAICFCLIRFLPVEGGVDKYAYFYLAIHALPTTLSIVLFYLRGKYVE